VGEERYSAATPAAGESTSQEEVKTNLQIGIEQQRAVYSHLRKPLLLQMAQLHQLTVRDIAEIFGIARSHAENILNHRKQPSLELALRLARYFEVTVDDLFGWMYDDDGIRRPLLIELPGTGQVARLKASDKNAGTLEMVHQVAELLRKRDGGGSAD
jgi:transcriptional regulator with XRE-family HTH domain